MIARDYQRAAVAAARDKTASDGNTLLMLPVGSGKTCIAGFYVSEEAARDPAAKFLVVQHTDELIDQNQRTIARITGLPSSVVKAERDDWSGRVVFGSVQTLGRATRRERMGDLTVLIDHARTRFVDARTLPELLDARALAMAARHYARVAGVTAGNLTFSNTLER